MIIFQGSGLGYKYRVLKGAVHISKDTFCLPPSFPEAASAVTLRWHNPTTSHLFRPSAEEPVHGSVSIESRCHKFMYDTWKAMVLLWPDCWAQPEQAIQTAQRALRGCFLHYRVRPSHSLGLCVEAQLSAPS